MSKRDEYLPYFEAVQDPDDWRNPIDAEVNAEDLEMTVRAIGFFAGTFANAIPLNEARTKYRVVSEGYRNGPCGP